MEPNKNPTLGLEERLSLADCHAHLFGRCVYKQTEDWHQNHYTMR